MTTAAENDILTRVGPGTPMGALMRQFWIPAAKSDELVADGDPVRLLLLGEKLVAFRDSSGRVGIMDHRCPHRCASLFFGRNEEGGLRCVYHGWKFAADGACLEQANVPPHQDFKHKVRARAYPTAERNGLVWVYMGVQGGAQAGDGADVPELPPIECTLLPEDDVSITFIQRECNWLQGLEGELDTSHIGFLHFGSVVDGKFEKNETNRFAVANRAPEYVSQETDYGYAYAAYRPGDAGELYWRFGQFLFPFWAMPPICPIGINILARGYIPMDDTHTMIVIVEKKGALEIQQAGENVKGAPGGVMPRAPLPNGTGWYDRYRMPDRLANDYGLDRDLQRRESYTGVKGFILQDQMITESMGDIVDRTHEHLAPSDVMINRVRRRLVKAARDLAKTGALPACAVDPSIYEGVRGGHFVEDESVDWLDAYGRQLRAAPFEPGQSSVEAAE